MLKDQYRCILEDFREAVKDHNVGAVCEMLKLLGHGDDMFWYVSCDGKLIPWTAQTRLDKRNDFFLSAKHLIPIEFIGGPQNDTLYRGSLLTFLLDRLLQYILKEGLEPIRKIEHILRSK